MNNRHRYWVLFIAMMLSSSAVCVFTDNFVLSFAPMLVFMPIIYYNVKRGKETGDVITDEMRITNARAALPYGYAVTTAACAGTS